MKYIVFIFFTLGALDKCTGGRWKIGEQFENALQTWAPLFLCMTGFMVLAPQMALWLTPLLSPLMQAIGADPSAVIGLILANDSGGGSLALAMADSQEAGLFHGMIVGAGMGTTVMLTMPLVVTAIAPEKQREVFIGISIGIITCPIGCLVGGLTGGYTLGFLIPNLIPLSAFAVLICILMAFWHEALMRAMVVFGRLLRAISYTGLIAGAMEWLTGFRLFPRMDTLENSFTTIGGICIFLAGIFPLLYVVKRCLQKWIRAAAEKMNVNEAAVLGILTGLANGLPATLTLNDMDARGRMIAASFLVSGSCVFGDHLAYTMQVMPEFCPAVTAAKLAGCSIAVLLSFALAPKLVVSKKDSRDTRSPHREVRYEHI